MLVSVLRPSETSESSHLLLFSEVGSGRRVEEDGHLKREMYALFSGTHGAGQKALLASVDSQLLSAQCQSGIFGDDIF